MLNRGVLSLALCAVLAGPMQQARSEDEGTLRALIPGEGEGRVFQVGPKTMLFLGELEGIMYMETSEGELDEAYVSCPVSQEINLSDQSTVGHGHCMITASGGDAVFAEFKCAGKVGGCRGEFTLTSGTGEFEGISGNSELVVRSPLRALVADMSSGSVLRAASGLAILPKLGYRIPKRK